MKVHMKIVCFSFYFVPMYSMELKNTSNSIGKVSTLKHLASQKVWEHQKLFFNWQEDSIHWNGINKEVQLDILSHCENKPPLIVKVLKNAQEVTSLGFIKCISEKIIMCEPIEFIEILEKESFPIDKEGYQKLLMTTILAKKYAPPQSEIKICVQPEVMKHQFIDRLNIILANPPRNEVRFEHNNFILDVTGDFNVRKTDKKNNKQEEYIGHMSQIIKLTCNKEGSCAVSGDIHGAVWHWNFMKGHGKKIGQHTGPVCGVKTHDFLVASFGTDKTVFLYSLLTQGIIKIASLEQPITCISFDSKDPVLLIYFNDKVVELHYPEFYLRGAFSPEQLIILGALKRLREGEKVNKETLEVFQKLLMNKKYSFDPCIQDCFEKEILLFKPN